MSDRLRLIALSFLMLFVELALIRWAGSNVLYLSYFSNFVLLGSFLGIGIGFLRADKKRNLFPFAPLALAALVAFVRFFPVEIRGAGGDLLFFGTLDRSGPPRYVVLTVIFIVVTAAMAFIGEGVARAFAKFSSLEAYRLDLIGSVLGILGFTALSFLGTPPLVWGVVATLVLLAAYWPKIRVLQVLGLIAFLAILAAESFASGTSWSPYYKIEVEHDRALNAPLVSVNGVPHQQITSAAGGSRALYALPYQRVAVPRDDVLIIGAGTGNDVALALAQGAKHVDAVEIDPRLYEIGKERHPDRPYADPRVDVHIDDGRAFMERTGKKYDLILFALPDSITLVSGQSSLRLESYLFTKESMEAARDLLKPGGAFAMYNYYIERWLVDRYAGTLAEVYGRPPCIDDFGNLAHLAFLEVAKEESAMRCTEVWTNQSSPRPEPSTDDHPFPYLRSPSLPNFYLAAIALILLASLVMIRVSAGPLRQMARYVDLFFMGAAFLLLETMNVIRFALYFGTTWFVNALVFAGVLASVLIAVEVSKRVTFQKPARLYLLLLAFLVVAFVVPPSWVLSLSPVPRFLAAGVLAFGPIFTANLVFTQRFKDVGSSTVAFGANLLGAMVGGLFEYSSLIFGYRPLLILVAMFYGFAFVLGRQHLTQAVPAT
jgi:hypothetical protein